MGLSEEFTFEDGNNDLALAAQTEPAANIMRKGVYPGVYHFELDVDTRNAGKHFVVWEK